MLIDQAARTVALTRWSLPECLLVPVAAVDESAVSTYVGEIVRVLADGEPKKALLVKIPVPPARDERLPVWGLEGSGIFYAPFQVWVHVAYGGYRRAYQKAFPTEDIHGKILSHAMNRRIAAQKGFQYVRITPASRVANSSSAFSENWGVALYKIPAELEAHRRRGAFIQYADLTDLMLMLDMKLGGGVMDAVNEGQRLVRPPT